MGIKRRMLPLLAVPLTAAALTVPASSSALAGTNATFGNVSCNATISGTNVYGFCGSPSAPNRSVTMHFGCNLDPVVHTANATPQYTVTNGKVFWVNYPAGYCFQGANNVYFTSP
jgi:hypothetical protein